MSQESMQLTATKIHDHLEALFAVYKQQSDLRRKIGESLNTISNDRLYLLCGAESMKAFFRNLGAPFSFSAARHMMAEARRRLNDNSNKQ